MANRYALRMDEPNSWTVFDIFTGQPAEFEKKMMVGIKTRPAEKIVGEMNIQDAKRREVAGRES
ncbi:MULTISPECIES: hypothetical protein [unclassified Mesorhizobium]|uniref:hypothetical protein n=1 Tax=unclassified Mesorhizobium TaxID=325217 RepID=UPI00241759B7|nr:MULTISPECIES: hypothetical protein [unclassified Mesorhizobium]MDG4904770.1 hypothetical protein [Mesorhizobium sp. WSM4962]MDG4920281.1 hypothetical protein [Mesorhizobium sp. WSM4989]